MEAEKKRAPNFSQQEKNLLTNIAVQFKNNIENKKTDAYTWRDKDNAWDKITNIFNSRSPEEYPRTKESLRKLFDNMKKTIRKEIAEQKKDLYKTGGGIPKKVITEDANSTVLLSIMNEKTVFGLDNPYDQDRSAIIQDANPSEEHSYSAALGKPTAEQDNLENIEIEVLEDVTNTPKLKDSVDWRKVAASDLKRPMREELSHSWTKRRRPTIQQQPPQLVEEYSSLAKIKIQLFEAEIENGKRKREREETIFSLEKRRLELDIQIRELQLKKLQQSCDFSLG